MQIKIFFLLCGIFNFFGYKWSAIERWEIARVGDMNIINFISQIKQELKPFLMIVLLRNLLYGIFNYYWILILKPML